MGFPILSLIVTRIIGIPQSLLLRVLGFPNSYPGSMGFPMPFSAFLRRSFFFFSGFWDSPILTRGLWDSPCPFPPFSEGLFFRVLGFPNSHPGSMGFPMPSFSPFSEGLSFLELSYPLQSLHEYPLVSPSLQLVTAST